MLCAANSFAGEKEATKDEKWGQIDPKIFANTIYADDTSAAAIILFDKGTMSFNMAGGYIFMQFTEHKRIQILRKEGFSQATIVLPYYSFTTNARGPEVTAQTLNLDSHGAVVKTKLPDNAIYDESIGPNKSAKKFSFADVREGSVIEFECISTANAGYLGPWFFQHDIPTLYSELAVSVPYYLHYSTLIEGKYKVEQSSEPFGTNAGDLKTTYTLKKVTAIQEEAFTTNLKDYRASIAFAIQEVTVPYTKGKSYHENWEEVARLLRESDYFGLRLNKNGDYINLAKSIANETKDAREKAKRIYNAVIQHVKWNNVYSIYPSDKLKEAFEKGKGNSADINMLLLDMLRAAGIKADPVLVSTRDHGRAEMHFPEAAQFNQVIVTASIDTDQIFIDATNDKRPYDLVGFNNLNTMGFRLTEPFVSWKPITAIRNSTGDINTTVYLDSAGNISGKGNITLSDYKALDARTGIAKSSLKEYVSKEFHKNPDINIISPKVRNLDSIDQNVKIDFEFKKDEAGAGNDKVIYLNPFALTFTGDNPFKLKQRDYPVDFGYPFEETFRATVFLPADYKVTEVPKAVNFGLPDGSGKFAFMAQVVDNMVQVRSTFKINKSIYKPGEYDGLKEIYAHMIDALNATFVLEKK
jgi:transglutaminase-like putative cysteine protease